jgi:hypothetical protein
VSLDLTNLDWPLLLILTQSALHVIGVSIDQPRKYLIEGSLIPSRDCFDSGLNGPHDVFTKSSPNGAASKARDIYAQQ